MTTAPVSRDDRIRRQRLLVVATGSLGTVLISVFSAGVGWVGPFSTIRTWEVLFWARHRPSVQALTAYPVILGGFLLVGAWLSLGRLVRAAERDDAVRLLVRTALIWALPLLVSLPLYSRDIFAYVGQGRLIADGLDPYQFGISAKAGWYGIGVDPMWTDTKTPYGPVIVWLGGMIVRLSGDSPILAVALFRLLAVVGMVALIWFGMRLAAVRGADPVTMLWLVAASPLALFIFVVSGHNDALMLALLVGSFYYASARHPVTATVLMTLSIGIKPIAIIALPVLGILLAGGQRDLRRWLRVWVVLGVVVVGILGAIGAALHLGLGWVSALETPGAVVHWYAPALWFSALSGDLTDLVGFGPGLGTGIAGWILKAAMVAAVATIMLTRRIADPYRRLGYAFLAVVLLSEFIHPWYAAWVIMLFAITGVPAGTPTRALTAATTFFCWISICDKTDSPLSVNFSSWPLIVHNVLAVVGALGLTWWYCRQYGIGPADVRRSAVRLRVQLSQAVGQRWPARHPVEPRG